MIAYGLSRLIDEDIYEVSVYQVSPTQLLLVEGAIALRREVVSFV